MMVDLLFEFDAMCSGSRCDLKCELSSGFSISLIVLWSEQIWAVKGSWVSVASLIHFD